MRRLCVRALAAIAVFAVPVSSAHAAAWLEPVGLSSAQSTAVAVATGAGGDTVGVWLDGSNVRARVRAPGGGFGDSQLLGTGDSTPDVAVSDDGTAIAVWRNGNTVYGSTRAPGGAFSTAIELSNQGSAPTAPQIVMNGRGDTVVAYARNIAWVLLKPAGEAFQAPKALSTAVPCDLRAAIGPAGHAAVVWHQTCAGPGEVFASRRRPGEGFRDPDVIGQMGDVPVVAVEADGTTAVAWEQASGIRAASANVDGGFGSPTVISNQNGAHGAPAIAAGGGEVWALWRQAVNGTLRVVGSRRPAGGSFGPVTIVHPEGVSAAGPVLAASSGGAFVAAWIRDVGDDTRVEVARRPRGAASFDAAAPLSAAGADATLPDLFGDPDGNVAAGYLRGGLPVAHVLDGAGPRLLGIEMRTTGFALEPYPFSVSPVDAWSAVNSTAFDFGDGSAAVPGPSATHAFPEPAAARVVTISGTDSLGNVSSVQRSFDVLPALDRTPPVVTGAKLDATRFRVSGKETAIAAAIRRGTRFRYTISEPGQAVFYFEREFGGRRSGRTCRRSRPGLRGKRCKFYVPVGLITRTHPLAGRVSVGFTGRMVGRNGLLKVVDTRLRPGRYRATLVVADALRNVSKPVQLGFTVVR